LNRGKASVVLSVQIRREKKTNGREMAQSKQEGEKGTKEISAHHAKRGRGPAMIKKEKLKGSTSQKGRKRGKKADNLDQEAEEKDDEARVLRWVAQGIEQQKGTSAAQPSTARKIRHLEGSPYKKKGKKRTNGRVRGEEIKITRA